MNWKENNLIRRVIMAFLGNYIISFGISFLYAADFGTDPFTCMNLGVSSHLPISLGTYQLLINIVLFAIIFVFDRRSFGIGAIINMVLLGYMIEFNVFWTDKLGIHAENCSKNYIVISCSVNCSLWLRNLYVMRSWSSSVGQIRSGF